MQRPQVMAAILGQGITLGSCGSADVVTDRQPLVLNAVAGVRVLFPRSAYFFAVICLPQSCRTEVLPELNGKKNAFKSICLYLFNVLLHCVPCKRTTEIKYLCESAA